MGNYNPTGPFSNGSAPGLSASLFNNIENVFVQPSGGTESGRYLCAGSGYANGCNITDNIFSLSRTSTPVSFSYDTTDVAPFGVGTPAYNRLTSGGVQLYAYTSGAQVNAGFGGTYTFQY